MSEGFESAYKHGSNLKVTLFEQYHKTSNDFLE